MGKAKRRKILDHDIKNFDYEKELEEEMRKDFDERWREGEISSRQRQIRELFEQLDPRK